MYGFSYKENFLLLKIFGRGLMSGELERLQIFYIVLI